MTLERPAEPVQGVVVKTAKPPPGTGQLICERDRKARLLCQPVRRPAALLEMSRHPTGFAIGYCRVSREEQARDGVSLDAQCARIRSYSEAKGLPLTEVLSDEGFSGKNLRRAGLEDLLEKCRRGEVGHVIVWELSSPTGPECCLRFYRVARHPDGAPTWTEKDPFYCPPGSKRPLPF